MRRPYSTHQSDLIQMKKHVLLLLLGLCLSGLYSSAFAQVQLSTSIFYGSPYVWRGQVLSTGFVFQPTVTASYQSFSLSFFGNLDPDAGEVARFNEADLTAAYAIEMDDVSIGAGYTFYTFPTPTAGELEFLPTQEVFASVGFSGIPLQPSLFAAYDFDTMVGLYAQAAIGDDVTIGGQAFTLGASLGLDSNFLFEDRTALSSLGLTVGTSFSTGFLEISPLIGFQIALDDVYEAQARAFGHNGTVFWGGIGISF